MSGEPLTSVLIMLRRRTTVEPKERVDTRAPVRRAECTNAIDEGMKKAAAMITLVTRRTIYGSEEGRDDDELLVAPSTSTNTHKHIFQMTIYERRARSTQSPAK